MPLEKPDLKEIKALIEWANVRDDVRRLSVKFGDVEVLISRDRHEPVAVAAESAVVMSTPAPPTPSGKPAPSTPAVAATSVPPVSAASADLADDEVVVKAPMVGTFYASPAPGAPPFVRVGDRVEASTVLGIVEVMKLMNSIEARTSGTVSRVLVHNEQPVEYGQALLVIKSDG